MSVIVPEHVLSHTKRCGDDYACLQSDPSAVKLTCEIDYAFGDNLLFIKALNSEPCPYRFSLGPVHICACPTRHFIHTHYPQKKRRK